MTNPDLINSQNPLTVSPIQSITAPLPATRAQETKYYVCTIPYASLHRTDGKKLPFVHGFLETDIIYDQKYLDEEIANGNSYIRKATEEEVFQAHMRKDPKSTIKAQVREEVKEELEETIRAQYEKQISDLMAQLQATIGTAEASNIDGAKLSATDILAMKKQKIEGDGVSVTMMAQQSPLKGIVSSADIAGAAATSNQK